MALLQLRIENGRFVETNYCNTDIFKPTHVSANGWECFINKDGSIMCQAVRIYANGEHRIRYVILPNGFARLSLKRPHAKDRTVKKGFVIPKGAILSDGIIGLSGGNIDERYAYFRDSIFQKFLDKFGITAVKNENPNQSYLSHNGHAQQLITDGNVKWCYDYGSASGRTDSDNNLYLGKTYPAVTGASWVIIENNGNYYDIHNNFRILYTSVKNVLDLEEQLMKNPVLSKYALSKEQSERLNRLNGKEINSIADIKSVIAEVLSIAPKMYSTVDNEKILEDFLKSFYLSDGHKFLIETCGPMSGHLADYEIRVVCRNGYSTYGNQLKIATGFLG